MSYWIRIQILWWLLLTSKPFPQIWVFLMNQEVPELRLDTNFEQLLDKRNTLMTSGTEGSQSLSLELIPKMS